MIDKKTFTELWKRMIENAKVTDPDSPYFGMLHKDAVKLMPDPIVDTCSQRLGDYLLDVANHTSLDDLAEKYPRFIHHTRDLKEKGCLFIDSIPPLRTL
jgi:hypothetical protein